MNNPVPENGGAAYRPVNCEFHDVLESAAVLHKEVPIVFQAADGATTTRMARIKDVYSKDGAEFITLDNGETIRLDALSSVDGVGAGQFD